MSHPLLAHWFIGFVGVSPSASTLVYWLCWWVSCSLERGICWLVDWSADLIDWWTGQLMVDWLVGAQWFVGFLGERCSCWAGVSVDWLVDDWWIGLLISWLVSQWLVASQLMVDHQLIDQLMTDWIIDWLAGWLIDVHWFRVDEYCTLWRGASVDWLIGELVDFVTGN